MRLRDALFACTIFAVCVASSGAQPTSASTERKLPVPKPVVNQKAMNKLGWKLACQAYTFREMTVFETLDTLKALGIRYIEFYPGQKLSPDSDVRFDHNSSPETIEAVKARLKQAGITAVQYGVVGLPTDEAESRKVFEFAKAMGIKIVNSEPEPAAFPMIDRLCQEYGMSVAIHNHPQPSHYWNPATVLEVAKDRSKRIGACADTGHWYRSGLNPVESLKLLEGRIHSLHFKDLTAEKRDTPWGKGVCDVPGMLAELKRQKAKPIFIIEYESTTGDELVSNVAKCVEAFSAYAEKLAAEK